MTALSKLAYHNMEALRLLALECADCGHKLGRHHHITNMCGGSIGGRVCKCKGWTDPVEQLAMP